MPRNQYGGRCYRCGQWCKAGAGHYERHAGGWRVQHAQCAIVYRGTDHTAENPTHEIDRDVLPEVICNYCNKPAQFVYGDFLYPHRPDLARKRFWMCTPCQAWVGCHDRNDKPRGPLADAELRSARQRAHYFFDRIWKEKHMKRGQAYAWLAERMQLTTDECHISQFLAVQCETVVEIARAYFAELEAKENTHVR